MAQHSKKAEVILAELEGSAALEGLDIVSVEVGGTTGRAIVRVRIENLDESPMDMDKVTAKTGWVSSVVERLDLFSDAYDLEVSSPGLDRPLRRVRDFARFKGQEVHVVLSAIVDGRMKGTGTIQSADDEAIVVLVDGKPWAFSIQDVVTAKLKPDYAAIFAAAKAPKTDEDSDDDADGACDLDEADEDQDGWDEGFAQDEE